MTDSGANMFSVSDDADIGTLVDSEPLFRCEVCNTGLVYGGRGRHPRFCDEHKPGRSSTGSGKGSGRQTKSLKAIEDSLAGVYTFVGMGVGFVDQFDGTVICDSAGNLAQSWVQLAASNDAWRKRLEKFCTGTGIGTVIFAHAMVAFPILQHHKLLPTFMLSQEPSNA